MIGINKFCREPTVIGDCIIDGDEACPVGEENAGVADLELPSETGQKNRLVLDRTIETEAIIF